jgi:hypothetical protein
MRKDMVLEIMPQPYTTTKSNMSNFTLLAILYLENVRFGLKILWFLLWY